MPTQYTFTLRSGVTLQDAAVFVDGVRYDVDQGLASGGGSIVTSDFNLASALMTLTVGNLPLLDVNGVEIPPPVVRPPIDIVRTRPGEYASGQVPTWNPATQEWLSGSVVLNSDAVVDLNVRSYAPTIDFAGGSNTTAAVNALAVAANALAVSRGQRVRLWGFAGAHLLVDGILSYERLKWEFEDAAITKVAGTNPMFYTRLVAAARTFTTATLTANTTSGSNSLTGVEITRPTGVNVDRPGKLVVGGLITGTGIPGGATIIAIDAANRTVTISANATATASKIALSHNPSFGTLTSGSPTVTGITTPLAWFVGRTVTGTGIPGGTTITAIDWTDPAAPIVTLSANATASGAQNLAVSGNTYFGNGRDIEVIGGTWDPNAFNTEASPMNGATIYPKYVENFVLEHATILHNWQTSGTWHGTWAMDALGYRGRVEHVNVLGGWDIHQDGPHLTGGSDWTISNNYVESGDDCFPFVNVPETLYSSIDPRPITDIVGKGNVGHAAKGHIFRPATEPGAISGPTFKPGPHFAITDIDFEASGSAGKYRNAGVGIFDESQPNPANRLLKRIKFRGQVDVGSTYHDGTGPYGVYVRGADDVTVDATVNVLGEGAAAIERYRVRETDRCTINLAGSGGTAAPLERRNRRLRLTEADRSPRRRSVLLQEECLALPLPAPWQALDGTDATSAVAAVANVEGGVIKLTPGRAGTGVAADGASIDLATLHYKLTTNGSLRFETRVKLTFLTGIYAFVGFVDQLGSAALTVPFQISGTTITPLRNNAVGFHYDALATGNKWWGVGVKDAAAVGSDLGINPVGGASAPWIDLAVEIDADGTALFESNGVPVGVPLANAVNITSLLTPCLRVSWRNTGTGNWGELHTDRFEAEMVRAR